MVALTQDRNTERFEGDLQSGPVAAGRLIFAGAIVMRTSDGHLTEGQTAVGLVGVGRAEQRVNNADGANGDVDLIFRPGIYRFLNSAGADEIVQSDIGSLAYVVDDQTVAKTDGGASRSPAGFIVSVGAQGVVVRFDAALTAAAS